MSLPVRDLIRTQQLPPAKSSGSRSIATKQEATSATTKKARNSDFAAPLAGTVSVLPAAMPRTTFPENHQFCLSAFLPTFSLAAWQSHPLLPGTLLPHQFSSIPPVLLLDQRQLASLIAGRKAAAARIAIAQQEYATDALRRMQIMREEAARSSDNSLPMAPLNIHQAHPSMLPATTSGEIKKKEPLSVVSFDGNLHGSHIAAAHTSLNLSKKYNPAKKLEAKSLPMQSEIMRLPASAIPELLFQKPRKREADRCGDVLPHQLEKEEEVEEEENLESPSPNKKRKFPTSSKKVIAMSTQQQTKPKRYKKMSPSQKTHKGASRELPRRPLNAYNFFFSEEREKILTSLGCNGEEEETTDEPPLPMESLPQDQPWHAIPLMQRLAQQHRTKKRRPHRKTHGKIGFKELTKLVASRWRNLPAERIQHYKDLAQMDLKRYEVEIEWWTSKGYNISQDGK